MTATVLHRPLSYDDLSQTPDDGNRYEIIAGELIVSASPIPLHQELVLPVADVLRDFVRPRRLGKVYPGPIDVKLTEHTILVPDVIFISRERLAIVGPTYVDGAPDLTVEILSPSTRRRDLVQKAALYAGAGVLEYWLLDPEARTLVINVLRDGRYEPVQSDGDLVPSRLLDGLVVDVPALFSELS